MLTQTIAAPIGDNLPVPIDVNRSISHNTSQQKDTLD